MTDAIVYVLFAYIFHRKIFSITFVTHQINVPEREECSGVVKTMKFHITFLCSDVFLNFSKKYSSQKGARSVKIGI